MTVVTAPTLTTDAAERLTLRISLKLDTLAEASESVLPLMYEAVEKEAWRVLGYNGISAWAEDRFRDALTKLDPNMRASVVRVMTDAGASTRAIAPVLGVSNKTVHHDRQVLPPVTPGLVEVTERHSTSTKVLVDTTTGEVVDQPKKTTGRDGKSYPQQTKPGFAPGWRPNLAPVPSAPAPVERRKPLADGFRDASLDLAKLITRLENLAADDRLSRNRDEVARYANDLIRARDALQGVINQMSQGKGTAA